MKKFSEFRNKLTAKQTSNYSLVSSLILTLVFTVLLTIAFWPSYEASSIILSALLSLIIFVGFYIFFCYFVFKSYDKAWTEKHENAKRRVISKFGLNTKTRTKVNYKFEEAIKDGSDKELLVNLLRIPEYEFYLRLTEGDTIEIIVTNKEQYIISVDTVANFIYVEAHFEKIDV